MTTLEEKFLTEKTYVHNAYIGNFIDRGLIHFNDNPNDAFFVDDKIEITVPLEPPLNGSVIVADEYNELGVWIPSDSSEDAYAAIMIVWTDGNIHDDRIVRMLHLTMDGRLVLSRETIDYGKVMSETLINITTKFFA